MGRLMHEKSGSIHPNMRWKKLFFWVMLNSMLAVSSSFPAHAMQNSNIVHDMLITIFCFKGVSPGRVQAVCKGWHELLADNEYYWLLLYGTDFGQPKVLPESWKDLYSLNLKDLHIIGKEGPYFEAMFAISKHHAKLLTTICAYPNFNADSQKFAGLNSLIYIASSIGFVEAIGLLIEGGADPNQREFNASSPLYVASQEGHIDVVKLLVEHKAIIEYIFREDYTPLYVSCQRGHIDVAAFLIEKGAKVNSRSANGSSPLYIACQEGNLECCKLLIEHGADLEVKFRTGFTPLYVASRNGHDKVVEYLLDKRARVDAVDNEGSTPLYVASQNGYHEIVKKLLDAGARSMGFLGGYTSIYVACQNGHDKVLKLLVEKFPEDVERLAPNDSTPLYVAAQNNKFKCVKILINAGALANGPRCLMYSPLYIACKKGHKDVAEFLLGSGALPNFIMGSCGEAALHGAVKENDVKIVEMLLRCGADPMIESIYGETAAQMADELCYKNVSILIKGHMELLESKTTKKRCLKAQ